VKLSLNLMTEQARRAAMLKESKRFWTRVLSGTAVLLACAGFGMWWQGSADSRRLATLEMRYAPVQTLQAECELMETQIKALRDAQQLVLQLVDTQPTVTLLGTLASATADTEGRIFVKQLDLEQPSNAAGPRLAVVIGVGKDNKAIAQFESSLRASELFADVRLNSSDSSDSYSDAARSFRIECQL